MIIPSSPHHSQTKYFIHHIVCGVKQGSFVSFFKTKEAVFDDDMERKDNLSSGAKGDTFFKEKMVNTCFILLIRSTLV